MNLLATVIEIISADYRYLQILKFPFLVQNLNSLNWNVNKPQLSI